MRKFLLFMMFLFLAVALTAGGSYAASLIAGATYKIDIDKINSNGSTSSYSSYSATADSSGKLTFSLSGVPTDTEANFFAFTIKDSNGVVQRKGFASAPHPGSTNQIGINDLSTAQARAIIAAGGVIGSDDPIAVAYLITMLRSSSATESDATTLAALGADAIRGNSGFEGFLLSSGVTQAQLDVFKKALIYNGTTGKKTIADLTAAFKTAVDSGNSATATREMQKAGGFMADVFMDAADAAGIDHALILAAHDAAGNVSENATNRARRAQLSSTVMNSMESSMSAFFMRIATVKVRNEYNKALSDLNASGSQKNRFDATIVTMMNSMQAIDETYGEYFMNPNSYVASHPGTSNSSIQSAINQAYQDAFQQMQTNITSTDADITDMRNSVIAAFTRENSGFSSTYLPGDFGKYMKFSSSGSTQVNWPIPQTVLVKWMAELITAGGTMGYTRDSTTAIPSMMAQWMGLCSDTTNPNYFNKSGCEGAGKIWTPGRRTYTTPSSGFNAYLGIMEDLQIIEFNKFALYNSGQPTRDQERDAQLLFKQRMDSVAGRISGTPTTAQKKAIVKLLQQPQMD